jgi:negative regulator of flagellin synthesis FlgM
MRIAGNGTSHAPAVERTPEAAAVDGSAPAAAQGGAATAAPMQSDVLQPALAALRDMPEIDHAKVAELRDALARGEVRFDAARLAGLIQRFHGAKS